MSVRDLGFHRLKDIEAPERIYQLVAAGLREQFPPLKSLGPPVPTVGVTAGVHGFPAVLTSFAGRSVELDEVADLLARHRMVTVTGPGGMGKTRLTGEVARRVADRFADGVWLAELAGVADPGLVPAAVAAALGMQHSGGPVMEAIAEMPAARQVLLVLVAQGRTNAQIAAQLSISVRTVRSRLDRIRAKTRSQRRADLTRLAMQADLV